MRAARRVMPTSRTGRIRERCKPGFTLLELLVTLGIMTVMSGVVLASMWPALSDARLRSSASIILGALRYARSYAVTHRTRAAVEFDTRAQGVSVLILETEENGEESWRMLTTPAGRYRALPDGVFIADIERSETEQNAAAPAAGDDGRETVTFTVLGQAEDARVILEDERGNRRIVQVDAITGRCELVDDAS